MQKGFKFLAEKIKAKSGVHMLLERANCFKVLIGSTDLFSLLSDSDMRLA